jgi:hypothetical protein
MYNPVLELCWFFETVSVRLEYEHAVSLGLLVDIF